MGASLRVKHAKVFTPHDVSDSLALWIDSQFNANATISQVAVLNGAGAVVRTFPMPEGLTAAPVAINSQGAILAEDSRGVSQIRSFTATVR